MASERFDRILKYYSGRFSIEDWDKQARKKKPDPKESHEAPWQDRWKLVTGRKPNVKVIKRRYSATGRCGKRSTD